MRGAGRAEEKRKRPAEAKECQEGPELVEGRISSKDWPLKSHGRAEFYSRPAWVDQEPPALTSKAWAPPPNVKE